MKQLSGNIGVQNLNFDGKGLSTKTMQMIKSQLQMNSVIHQKLLPNLRDVELGNAHLNLAEMNFKDVSFLQKFLQSYTALKVLDLSNNALGDEGAQQIEAVLQTSQIEKLNISHNNIGPNGLQKLCSVLSKESCTVTTLDIRNNNIPDHSLKILLACLYKNDSL